MTISCSTTYLSDRVIVYSGTPSVESFATAYVVTLLLLAEPLLTSSFAPFRSLQPRSTPHWNEQVPQVTRDHIPS